MPGGVGGVGDRLGPTWASELRVDGVHRVRRGVGEVELAVALAAVVLDRPRRAADVELDRRRAGERSSSVRAVLEGGVRARTA